MCTNKQRFLVLLVLLVLPGLLFAQSRDQYNLLWKISGNGLDKPSYLMGSMHVKDSRAFDFSDSVLVALQRCEGFALEVHPDSIMEFSISESLNQRKDQMVRDMLDLDEYNDMSQWLRERGQVGSDVVSYRDPWLVELVVSRSPEREDDMDVVLDTWLYRQASRHGKKIFGVESIKGHFGLLDDLQEEQRREVYRSKLLSRELSDELIRLYHEGNIEGIQRYFDQSDMNPEFKYKLLDERNRIMANNMDVQSKAMSMFYVVGVAHLPGPQGVIALLKEKGYTLELSLIHI